MRDDQRSNCKRSVSRDVQVVGQTWYKGSFYVVLGNGKITQEGHREGRSPPVMEILWIVVLNSRHIPQPLTGNSSSGLPKHMLS